MQEFTIFDIVIVSITLLLGLKGLLKGFIKEVFGLVGIIGGLFVASRMAAQIGDMVAPILGLENNATIQLIGFIAGLIGFWIIIYLLGLILSSISSASGLGLFDRLFGFIFGMAKIFMIFSVIAYALYQVNSFKNLMDNKISTSTTLPYLIELGGFIVKLDTTKITNAIDEKLETTTESTAQTTKKITEDIKKAGSEVVDTVKEAVKQNVEQIVEEVKTKEIQTQQVQTENKE